MHQSLRWPAPAKPGPNWTDMQSPSTNHGSAMKVYILLAVLVLVLSYAFTEAVRHKKPLASPYGAMHQK